MQECPHCNRSPVLPMSDGLLHCANPISCGWVATIPAKLFIVTDLDDLKREVQGIMPHRDKFQGYETTELCKVCGEPIGHKLMWAQKTCCSEHSLLWGRYLTYVSHVKGNPMSIEKWLARREEKENRGLSKHCVELPAEDKHDTTAGPLTRRRHQLPYVEVVRINELTAAGASIWEIVHATGISQSCVAKYVKKYWEGKEGRPVHKGGRG